MTQQTALTLAQQIRKRRIELNLTVEEAAAAAGVGTKTWYRYEAGASMRKDKYKGVCKSLRWRSLPGLDENTKPLCQRKNQYWSTFLEKEFGKTAAYSFAIGCEILEDELREDMNGLLALPTGSHIGQLDISMLSSLLPPQFQTNYDYSFLYRMKCTLKHLQEIAKSGLPLIAHSVLEELIIYFCAEEAESLLENDSKHNDGYSVDWVFDLFDDMDIITFLYSDMYLEPNDSFHFQHWADRQFYIDA